MSVYSGLPSPTSNSFYFEVCIPDVLSEEDKARQEFPPAWMAEDRLILGQWPVVFVLHPCVHLL